MDNALTGNDGNNYLNGLAGNDVLNGEGGLDTLDGGEGNDTLNGGDFDGVADLLRGGAGDDVYIVDSVIDVLDDLVGNDVIKSSVSFSLASSLIIGGRVENLILTGVDHINGTGNVLGNTITGNLGNNSLDGGAGSDTLLGEAGNDTLNGGSADDRADSLVGASGDDYYIIDSSRDFIIEVPDLSGGIDTIDTTFNMTLQSGSGIENIVLNNDLDVSAGNINATGDKQANSLAGNRGNNLLDGGDDSAVDTLDGTRGSETLTGRDTLIGGRHNVGDYLLGGINNDFYYVYSNQDFISDAGGDSDLVISTVSFDLNSSLVAGLEHLTYSTLNDNTLEGGTLTGNDKNNSLTSESQQDDTLIGGDGSDTLDGGGGDNSLVGGNDDDYYIIHSQGEELSDKEEEVTLGGWDTAIVQIAGDTLGYSVGGRNYIENITYNGKGKATLSGSDSANIIQGGDYGNSLSGGAGNDSLFGGAQVDTLVGGNGDDYLDGKAGINSLDGGLGNDFYRVRSQSENITDSGGDKDTIRFGDDTDRAAVGFSLSYNQALASIENLELDGKADIYAVGNDLANSITGNDGDNAIDAKVGNDTVLGGLGADRINGNEGNDSLVGGGRPQTDLPDDASTAILMVSGQSYDGKIDAVEDTDW
ncbi:MAG: hypothetical protein NTZ94_13855, partial [Verrucomicrobia bacterium]|nr:hypothetical protein [Verrucomicrobiota bacterium]